MKSRILWLTVFGILALTGFAIIVSGKVAGWPKQPLSNTSAAPAQPSQKIEVPFKGEIAKVGRVNLILRMYDQPEGGTKLFEERQEVEVTQGRYLAFVELPSEAMMKNPTVWLEASEAATSTIPLEPRTPFTAGLSDGVTPQARTCLFGGCASLCSTCGGAYPVFGGILPLQSNVQPTMRGGSCSGSLVKRSDPFPFLCTQ